MSHCTPIAKRTRPITERIIEDVQEAANAKGLQLRILKADVESEIGTALFGFTSRAITLASGTRSVSSSTRLGVSSMLTLAFASLVELHAGALVLAPDTFFNTRRELLVTLPIAAIPQR